MEVFEVLAFWQSLNVGEKINRAEFYELYFNQTPFIEEIRALLTGKEKMDK